MRIFSISIFIEIQSTQFAFAQNSSDACPEWWRVVHLHFFLPLRRCTLHLYKYVIGQIFYPLSAAARRPRIVVLQCIQNRVTRRHQRFMLAAPVAANPLPHCRKDSEDEALRKQLAKEVNAR